MKAWEGSVVEKGFDSGLHRLRGSILHLHHCVEAGFALNESSEASAFAFWRHYRVKLPVSKGLSAVHLLGPLANRRTTRKEVQIPATALFPFPAKVGNSHAF